jgi:hypothetical protein
MEVFAIEKTHASLDCLLTSLRRERRQCDINPVRRREVLSHQGSKKSTDLVDAYRLGGPSLALDYSPVTIKVELKIDVPVRGVGSARLMNLESFAPKELADEPLELPSIEESDIGGPVKKPASMGCGFLNF